MLGLTLIGHDDEKQLKEKFDNFCKFFQTNFERDNSHSRSMSRAVYKIQFKYTYLI